MELSIKQHGITITETRQGLEVEQNGQSYLAREWTLSREVYGIIRSATKAGFTKLWVNGHPRGAEAHYICFARDHEKKWDFLIAGEGLKVIEGESTTQVFTVNKEQAGKLRSVNIPFKIQTGGGKHLEVKPVYFHKMMSALLSTK